MNSPFLVTPQWLANHLNNTSIIILDARMSPPDLYPKKDMKAEFERGHIPGAVYFDINEIADITTALPHMLPSPDIFSKMVGQIGISNQQTIIVYDDNELFSAPRVWWTFRTFGAKNVYVLDGGLSQWQKTGHIVETKPIARSKQVFISTFDQHTVKTTDNVLAAIDDKNIQILDARSAARFSGEAQEPRQGLRSGHIPGSINIPYTEILEDGKLKSQTKLRQTFKNKGVDLNQPIITSCGSGITAAILALGLHSIDAKTVTLYDGSWAQWGASDNLPIE